MDRFRRGDEHAADELYLRYAQQLAAVARSHLSGRLSRRLDPEDIVQSAYRSFFMRAREGEYALYRGGDLWRLLVGILRHKLLSQVERHTADRRTIRREDLSASDGTPAGEVEPLAHEPSPEEAALAAELLADIMSSLAPDQRRVLELRLQDCTLDEIAAETGRSERTVRRWLESIKARLKGRLES